MIQLYGRRNSINVQKVSWALCELNLEFKWHDEHGKFGKVNVENYEKIKLSTIGDELRPGIIHRIDKDTSGLEFLQKAGVEVCQIEI